MLYIDNNTDSERALLSLSLHYELTTNRRLRWRKEIGLIYELISDVLKGDNNELKNKADIFLETLDTNQRAEFKKRDLIPVDDTKNSNRVYRGAVCH